MMKEQITKANVILHGADYNPDQWLHDKKILEQDIEYMKKAKINCVTIGIFAWAALEPEEGKFTFEWLDDILDKLYANGISFMISTPSGARPAWMSKKYPEVLKVLESGQRIHHGERHNHCYTSPVYREKVRIINQKLADRYANHKGLLMWHISNEMQGACYCELCQAEFREFLKDKYKTIDNLNLAWWNTFWSHTYNDFSQVEAPSTIGENRTSGLFLDWYRFVTKQHIEFYLNETRPLKKANPNIPCSTNFMGLYWQINYAEMAKHLDIVSWDSYPLWHNGDDVNVGMSTSMLQEFNRSLKDKPFLLIECTPSMTNWQEISKLKKPGMNKLSSMQAVAHGSDSVIYFQWRKARGGNEKFHGAIVDHDYSCEHRVFKDVESLSVDLAGLDAVVGTRVNAEVALIFDWENSWAISKSKGPRNKGMKYNQTVQSFYKPFWEKGIPVDIISQDRDLSKYKVVIAPMLYAMKDVFANNVKNFVKNGGTLVTTYFTDYVNENDLCHFGGFPGQIADVLGIKADEIDGLYDGEKNGLVFSENNSLGLTGDFPSTELCELLTLKTAKSLATYKSDFYQGTSCMTVNRYGLGDAYHIATRCGDEFNTLFINKLVEQYHIEQTLNSDLPLGVTATKRTDGETDYIFILNFNEKEVEIKLDNRNYVDIYTKKSVNKQVTLEPFGVQVYTAKK